VRNWFRGWVEFLGSCCSIWIVYVLILEKYFTACENTPYPQLEVRFSRTWVELFGKSNCTCLIAMSGCTKTERWMASTVISGTECGVLPIECPVQSHVEAHSFETGITLNEGASN
jgi:hypothetical protein